MSQTAILNQLADGRLSYKKALRLIEKNSLERPCASGSEKARNRCLSIHIRTDSREFWLRLPLWLGEAAVLIGGIIPAVRHQLRHNGLKLKHFRRIFQQLRLPENALEVDIAAHDGLIVSINNTNLRALQEKTGQADTDGGSAWIRREWLRRSEYSSDLAMPPNNCDRFLQRIDR